MPLKRTGEAGVKGVVCQGDSHCIVHLSPVRLNKRRSWWRNARCCQNSILAGTTRQPDQKGDRVKIVHRKVTDDDRKKGRYFEHMGGLLGTVQNVYSKEEIEKQLRNSLEAFFELYPEI